MTYKFNHPKLMWGSRWDQYCDDNWVQRDYIRRHIADWSVELTDSQFVGSIVSKIRDKYVANENDILWKKYLITFKKLNKLVGNWKVIYEICFLAEMEENLRKEYLLKIIDNFYLNNFNSWSKYVTEWKINKQFLKKPEIIFIKKDIIKLIFW